MMSPGKDETRVCVCGYIKIYIYNVYNWLIHFKMDSIASSGKRYEQLYERSCRKTSDKRTEDISLDIHLWVQ